MAAVSAVAPVVAKVAAVSTGKAANTNSMMVWQPHNNRCVSHLRFSAESRRNPDARFSFFFLRSRLGHCGARKTPVGLRLYAPSSLVWFIFGTLRPPAALPS